MTNSLFLCKGAVRVPNPETASDPETAVYVARLEDRGEDCSSQLFLVRDLLQVQGVLITDTLVETPKKERSGLFGFLKSKPAKGGSD